MSRVVFAPKRVNEIRFYSADFTSSIIPGQTITSYSATAYLYSGVDPSPAAIISGAASIIGNIVYQKIGGGVAGATYVLSFLATLSDGTIVTLNGYLTVLPVNP